MSDTSRSKIKQKLHEMEPYEFEKLISEIWSSLGYKTNIRNQSKDRGIDVEAVIEQPIKQNTIIQVKRYKKGNKVGSQEVRNYATLYQQEEDIDLVSIVTSSTFTREAIGLAQDLNIQTVNGGDIVRKLIENDTVLEDFNLLGEGSNSEIEESIEPIFNPEVHSEKIKITINPDGKYSYNYDILIREKSSNEVYIQTEPEIPMNEYTNIAKNSTISKDDFTLMIVEYSDKNELVNEIQQIMEDINKYSR